MRVLTVCLGNICRSPTAEAALRQALEEAGLADAVEIDSAGTGSWHRGEPPDRRMREAAARHGLDMRGQARQIRPEDLEAFDLVLTMDRANHRDVMAMAADDEQRAKVRMFREFDPEGGDGAEVPDPYFGGQRGFDEVVEIVRRTAERVVDHLAERVGQPR